MVKRVEYAAYGINVACPDCGTEQRQDPENGIQKHNNAYGNTCVWSGARVRVAIDSPDNGRP